MTGLVDAHFHIWRQADLPWLLGPMQPRIFGPYEPIRRDYPVEEYLADCRPEGVTEAQVRAIFRKRFSGGTLTASEQQVMQQLMKNFGGGRAGAGRRAGAGNDFQFGGNYIVFVRRNGSPTPVMIRTGLTDLDYSEVVSGLSESDSVLVLPSASLVQSQQEMQERANRATGGGAVPGMRQQQQQTGGAR